MHTPGLTQRLRQHSRRAGLAIGLSMAITIALLIGSFSWIYAKIDPLTQDFVNSVEVTTTAAPAEVASAPTNVAGETPAPEPTAPPENQAPEAPTQAPTPTPTPDAFRTTHLSNPELSVNLRPAASVNNEPVAVLAAGTPLQFLDEEQTGDDGAQWFKFRTEDGDEGWLREGTFVESTG